MSEQALLGPTPALASERLRLAPLEIGDAADLAAAMSDPNLYGYIGGAPPMVDEVAARLRRYEAGPAHRGDAWHNWAIRLGPPESDAGRLIGHLQATVSDGGAGAEIAWLVGTPWQGRGYAVEAARVLVQWLLASGTAQVDAHIAPGHRSSEGVAAAAGLERTSEVEDGEAIWRRVSGPCEAIDPEPDRPRAA